MVAFSCAIVVGSVGLSAARSFSTSAMRFFSAALPGSTVIANFAVRERVFVAAIELRVVGKRAQLLERVPHHRMVALDDAAAAERKDRVADEDELFRRHEERDVIERVARRRR